MSPRLPVETLLTRIQTPRACDMAAISGVRLRESFLLGGLFQPGLARLFLTDLDRLVVGGVAPRQDLALPAMPDFGGHAFTARREIGIINIGDPGGVTAGETRYSLDHLDCLYIGRGEQNVVFHAPGLYYLLSCPAHSEHPTRKAAYGEARVLETGTPAACSRRKISQYIYPGGIASAQLVMGFTELAPGNVWNTTPPHTHLRRTEIYFYFDLDENIVVHLLGEPSNTRHLIVRNREAVLSPSWSIHSGVGTADYRFIWGMAGENQQFDDMDPVSLTDLR